MNKCGQRRINMHMAGINEHGKTEHMGLWRSFKPVGGIPLVAANSRELPVWSGAPVLALNYGKLVKTSQMVALS